MRKCGHRRRRQDAERGLLDGCVPTHPATVLTLGGFVSGEVWFLFDGDVLMYGVVSSSGIERLCDELLRACVAECNEARAALLFNQAIERFQPFLSFLRVVVWYLTQDAVDYGAVVMFSHESSFLSGDPYGSHVFVHSYLSTRVFVQNASAKPILHSWLLRNAQAESHCKTRVKKLPKFR